MKEKIPIVRIIRSALASKTDLNIGMLNASTAADKSTGDKATKSQTVQCVLS